MHHEQGTNYIYSMHCTVTKQSTKLRQNQENIFVFRDNKASIYLENINSKGKTRYLNSCVSLTQSKNMQYQGFIFLFILLLKCYSTEESGYNCSEIQNRYGYPLEECLPAKFMLKNHLVECFDSYSKSEDVIGRSSYFHF